MDEQGAGIFSTDKAEVKGSHVCNRHGLYGPVCADCVADQATKKADDELNRRRGQMKVAERAIRRALGLFAYSVDRSLMDSSDEVMHELKAALVYLGDEK